MSVPSDSEEDFDESPANELLGLEAMTQLQHEMHAAAIAKVGLTNRMTAGRIKQKPTLAPPKPKRTTTTTVTTVTTTTSSDEEDSAGEADESESGESGEEEEGSENGEPGETWHPQRKPPPNQPGMNVMIGDKCPAGYTCNWMK